MATLVANNAESAIGRLTLRPGINTLGRSEGNHHVLTHSSVSSRHCEVVVHDTSVSVRDLGSTNGTFIEDQPVAQGTLAHGQRLKVGSVEFVLDAPELVAAKAGPLRVTVPRPSAVPLAADSDHVGHTASEAIAALAPTLEEQPGFYRQIPGSFAYPFTKSGLFLLVLGTLFFFLLSFGMQMVLLLSIFFIVVSGGYLFTYMQRIISTTAQGEDEVPDFPDFSDFWSDILLPFLLYSWTLFVCLLPVLLTHILMRESDYYWWAVIGVGVVCGLYFPMALLAVSVTDTFLAVSPHVVFPSVLRIPGAYLVTCLILSLLGGVRYAIGYGLEMVPFPIVPDLVDGFVSLCILVIQMRLLGLLFRSHRKELGWL